MLEVPSMDQTVQTKWEYLVEEIGSLSALKESLGQAGTEGWELVSVTHGGASVAAPAKTLRARKPETFCVFFKRPGF